ncbi:hypothetical protein [Endozoicomonas ascidiicola]|uniref:hypothetical protein n=1 Tax=Endozoicomonas ascidiicola TaxID=1698521 RepID=UPI00082B721A|nr:hypothetical protein [Endozoicomonas ascidiicola]
MYKKYAIALPAIGLLVCALIFAFNLVSSEVWRFQSHAFLDYWAAEAKKKASFAPKQEEWELALSGADKAMDKMPMSPELQVVKAKVLGWGLRKGFDTMNEQPELPAWQDAIIKRPGWPYSWSHYAQARAQRSLIDDEFESALLRANQLGFWEKEVILNGVIMSKHYAGWVSDSLLHRLNNSIDRLEGRYPRLMQKINRQYSDTEN